MPVRKTFNARQAVAAIGTFAFTVGISQAAAQDASTAAIASAAQQTSNTEMTPSRPLSCADRYHSRLQNISGQEYAELQTALETITTANPSVPTGWRFWAPVRPRGFSKRRRKDGTIRPMIYQGRVCSDERIMRNGRPRCFKWEPSSKERIAELTRYVPPLDPAAPQRERRDLRFLNDTVVSKGALSAFQSEGRYFWLVRRAVSELGMYVGQGPNPGLCLGAKTLLSFYKQQFQPLNDRMQYVQSLGKRADARYAAQIKSLKRLEAARQKIAAAAKRKAEAARRTAQDEARKAGLLEATDATPAAQAIPPRVLPASVRSDDPQTRPARVLPEGQIGNIARALAFISPDDPSDEPELETGMPVGTALDKARAYIDQRRDEPISERRRGHILRALRAVETRMMSESTAAIYATYQTAVANTLGAIDRSHTETCNCR